MTDLFTQSYIYACMSNQLFLKSVQRYSEDAIPAILGGHFVLVHFTDWPDKTLELTSIALVSLSSVADQADSDLLTHTRLLAVAIANVSCDQSLHNIT